MKADHPIAPCGSNPWYCQYDANDPLCCQSKEAPAVSSDWEGAFLSKEEVETVKMLIGDWLLEWSSMSESNRNKTGNAVALGRRLGMPDMDPEEE